MVIHNGINKIEYMTTKLPYLSLQVLTLIISAVGGV